jgi:hypothetical protein
VKNSGRGISLSKFGAFCALLGFCVLLSARHLFLPVIRSSPSIHLDNASPSSHLVYGETHVRVYADVPGVAGYDQLTRAKSVHMKIKTA